MNPSRGLATLRKEPSSAATWVLIATILGSSMEFIDGTVVNIALPSIQRFYHATAIQTEWIVAGYAMALSSLLLPLGALGDRLGQRKLFGAGILVFALSSCWCAVATSISLLLLGRVLQGVGGASLVANSLAFLSRVTPPPRRVQAIGTWSAFTSLMIAAGPPLGGWLVQTSSWRWVFLLNILPAAVALWITFTKAPRDVPFIADSSFDLPGTVLVVAAVSVLTVGLLQIEATPGSAAVELFCAVTLSIIFLRWEARASRPLLPLRLLGNATFRRANILTFLLYGALAPLFYYLPLKLIQTESYTPQAAGVAMLPLVLTLTLVAQFTGPLSKAFSAGRLLTCGPLITGAGLALIGTMVEVGSYWIALAPGLFLVGAGVAITVPPLTNLALTSGNDAESGISSGVNNTMAQVASLVTLAASTPVFLHTFASSLSQHLRSAVVPHEAALIFAQRRNLGSIIATDAAGAAVIRQAFAHSFSVAAALSSAMALAARFVGSLLFWASRRLQSASREMPARKRA